MVLRPDGHRGGRENQNMYYLYIAQSKKNGRYYIGSTNEPERRIIEHNAGKTKSLHYLRPLEIVFCTGYPTISEAHQMEMRLKRWKNRKIFDQIIKDGEIKFNNKGL